MNEHHAQEVHAKVTFGFWTYLMTDLIMFATLVATYIVLHNNVFGGPGIQELTNLPYVLIQTLLVLTGAFACRVGLASFYLDCRKKTAAWLVISLAFAVAFCWTQYHQFDVLLDMGISYQNSGFLSAFFTLLAIFAVHVMIAIFWTVILLIQFCLPRFAGLMKTRLTCLSLFWSFLSIVWLVILTVVYLMGAL